MSHTIPDLRGDTPWDTRTTVGITTWKEHTA